MKAQINNNIVSSFLLMVDHQLQREGQAFTNYSGLFYPVPSDIKGLHAYTAPFKQLCNDTSISGAKVLSGVYLNGNYVSIGQSGLKFINHYKSAVYFSSGLPTNTVVSGVYAVKDFSVVLTDLPEWELMTKTHYSLRNEYAQNLTGLSLEAKTTPIVYLSVKGDENEGFGFNHLNNNYLNIRAVIIADNEFQNIAASNILKNFFNWHVPYVVSTPFDSLGNITGVNYDYTALSFNSGINPWIEEARAVRLKQRGEMQNMVKNMSMVDFRISTILLN